MQAFEPMCREDQGLRPPLGPFANSRSSQLSIPSRSLNGYSGEILEAELIVIQATSFFPSWICMKVTKCILFTSSCKFYVSNDAKFRKNVFSLSKSLFIPYLFHCFFAESKS